jgi:malate dehydrogenase (oxaloacetate-decarboxylating)
MTDTGDAAAKASKPAEDAMKLHPFYRGKIQMVPKCCIRGVDDFAIWYTPGVAAPCRDIQANPEKVFEHTNKANRIAVVSNGTRVLGLGNIGAEAGLPVMEGKALLFKYLGGVDTDAICVDTEDPDKFIEFCKMLQPSYGGFNLEDIKKPDCFRILDTLRAECRIPVWHDDQQGTAAVTFAGLVNACRFTGRELGDIKIVQLGSGAANVCIYRVMKAGGVDPANVTFVDSKGILSKSRTELKEKEPYKWELIQETNGANLEGGLMDALKGADCVIALSKSRKSLDEPPVIPVEGIKTMAKDPIVFACANPNPEILPDQALEAGAAIVATGRSDFPNQVNNSLGFPGIFRGTLDVMAKTITDEMCIAAAMELANVANDRGIKQDYLIPTMDDWEVFPREAAAVAVKAVEQGVARIELTWDEAFEVAKGKIEHARKQAQILMESGNIPMPEE